MSTLKEVTMERIASVYNPFPWVLQILSEDNQTNSKPQPPKQISKGPDLVDIDSLKFNANKLSKEDTTKEIQSI